VTQPDEAPLAFVISGFGSDHNTRYGDVLARALYRAGFHVALLPSPTHGNFIVSASSSGVPGNVPEDARDLHRVMRLVDRQIRGRGVAVSGFHLAGWSLGGLHAAYVAKLDDEEEEVANRFGFERVLLIDPPVSLYRSIEVLDDILAEHLPAGPGGVEALLDEVITAASEIYERTVAIGLDEDFLYRAFLERRPSDEELAALVGLYFRLVSSSMVLTSDILTNAGYIFPEDQPFRTTTPLTEAFEAAMRIPISEHVEDYFVPSFRGEEPGLTEQELWLRASLTGIADYLSSARNIGLIANVDDVILAEGDVERMRAIFGPRRARIYPSGGHLGNLGDPAVVADIVGFLRGRNFASGAQP
jgi:pimeloyl-ACP methyl ester carboxylesterase